MASDATNVLMLESNRLYLRPWQMEDASILYEISKDEEIGPRCGWSPHTSIEHSCFILKNILMVEDTYAIVLKENNTVIGNIALMHSKDSNFARNENEGEVGFWLDKKYWNKGYMQEALHTILHYAFLTKDFSHIWAGYFEDNNVSKHIQEKTGFTYHHTVENLYVHALHKKVQLNANVLKKEDYLKKYA